MIMFTSRKELLRIAIALCVAVANLAASASEAGTLSVLIEPRFDGKPLEFDSIQNVTAAGQNISVKRLDFLLSNISLRQTNGNWLTFSNEFAYINARDGRTSFELSDLPAGTFDAIRFHVGLPSEINHSDPAQYPAAVSSSQYFHSSDAPCF